MLEEDYDPNGYATFFMKSVQLAARWSLAGSSAPNRAPTFSDWPFNVEQQDWWHNALDFAGPGSEGLHCFETAIKIRHKPFSYFRDRIDTEYVRATVSRADLRHITTAVCSLRIIPFLLREGLGFIERGSTDSRTLSSSRSSSRLLGP